MRDLRTSRRALMVVLLVCFVAATVPLQAASASYKWTVDQRLRARFDPHDVEKRREAIDMVPRPDPDANVVDGSKNPELLLPTELFPHLLKRGFAENLEARKAFRDKVEPIASELGIGPDLWPVLRKLAADLLPSDSKKMPTWEGLCRRNFEALEAAREAFGEKAFDRMLYEVVAPEIKISARGNGPELEKELRDMEDGCRESSRTPGAM